MVMTYQGFVDCYRVDKAELRARTVKYYQKKGITNIRKINHLISRDGIKSDEVLRKAGV